MSDLLGGWKVELKAAVDNNSFNQADKRLKDLEGGVSKLLGTVKKSAPLILAQTAGAAANAELKVSRAIGISTNALGQWKAAAGAAGVSAAGLTSSMQNLENRMQKMKLGQVDMGLAKNLGMLGLGLGDFSKMDATARMQAVFNQADKMKDQQKAATLVGETLGSSAREYYDWLKISGKTLDQQLAEAKALSFTDDATNKKAQAFHAEIKAIFGAGKSIMQLLGSEIAAKLTPTARRIKNWIIDNRQLITSTITGFVAQAGAIFDAIAGVIGKVGPLIGGIIDKFGGLDKLVIKIGLGFATWKMASFAHGISTVVKSIGLLKTGLTGLGLGALGLLAEDFYVYFAGGDSLIGWLLRSLKEIQKDMGMEDLSLRIKEIADNLKTAWENTKGFRDALAGITKLAITETLELIIKDLDGLSALLLWTLQLFNKLQTEGLKGGFSFIKESITDSKDSDKEHPILEMAAKTMGVAQMILHPGEAVGKAVAAGMAAHEAKKEKTKENGAVHDGVIRPDGRVTQVAPDDWVIAARDLGDVAAAFIPQAYKGSSNTTNSVSAPVEINQTINVNGSGSIAQTVKSAAYSGARDAMQQSLKRSAQVMQLMPGTR